MDWWVSKTGMEMFDVLHAYGLGVLLATASEESVTLQDEGLAYRISSEGRGNALCPTLEILDQILQLPTGEEVASLDQMRLPLPPSFSNVDGLLAALYTQQGIKLVSLAELQQKQRWAPAVGGLGIQKIQQTLTRLKRWVERQAQGGPMWLEHVLKDYSTTPAPTPTFSPVLPGKDFSLWLTLDPALGKSTRQPVSDGLIAMKSNLTMSSPRYGVCLSVIGAARFLRAQPIAGQLINYYLPLPTTLTITPETILPTLPVGMHPARQALVAHWLAYVRPHPPLGASWQALAYQTLSSGGTKQALSITRGALPFEWMVTVGRRTGPGLIHFWRSLLQRGVDQAPYEVERLCDTLMSRDTTSWWTHLIDHARAVARFPEGLRPYTDVEFQEVTQTMTDPSIPLIDILERKEGTLRFGHALRLLGQVNHAKLLDLFEQFERIQTLGQLLDTLNKAAQACELANARSPFIIVPSDDDLKYLIGDSHRYGVRLISSLLQILAVLRYPQSGAEVRTGNAGLADAASAAILPPAAAPPEFPAEGGIAHDQ